MMKVKNLNGTSDNKVPSGYISWKDWWEKKSGKTFSTCSCSGCSESAKVGGHVQKNLQSDRSWYIVPLCNSCNVAKKDIVFEVRDADLEPVAQK